MRVSRRDSLPVLYWELSTWSSSVPLLWGSGKPLAREFKTVLISCSMHGIKVSIVKLLTSGDY